jgi:voltage-gated potassium channel
LRKLLALFPPNWCLAILVALDGYAFMHPVLREVRAREYGFWLAIDNWHEVMRVVGLLEIPRLVLGVGLQVIALGLILKARIAWAFSLVLLIGVGTFAIMGDSGRAGLGIYTLVLVIALIAYWRRFDRASVTAGSLFALVSMLSLLIYAVFGTLYLGNEFNPPITDATTALYFSIVSMSTVGYGDITPHTGTARLFTASIIILGITIFATSISAIAGPVIGGNLKRLVKGRFSTAMRKNHIIIAGATPLAMSVYDGLRRRGDEVTVIVPPGVPQEYPAATDLIEGDPSSVDVLHNAGVTRARYVLALRDDDAENAFIVLAAKEACGENGAKTVALVNTSKHLEKIRRVNPDLVFSVQLLGAELLARAINGEPMDSQSITDLFFAKAAPNGKAA